MNILIMNWRDRTHPKSGGAEIVTMQHAKGWVQLGHRVTWLTSWYQGASHDETIEGVHIIRRGGSWTVYALAPFFLLRHGDEYDVIVDEVHGIPFFSPLFTRKKAIVVFIHEIAGDIWDYMFRFPISTLGKLFESWYFSLYRGHMFWTDAPSMVKELEERGIKKSMCVSIPCPITIDKGLMIKDRKNPSKEITPTYIFVSRVVKMKGIEEVVKAFSFILKEQKDAVLWIVGGGEEQYIKELRHMMEEYGILRRVTFFGRVSEKKKFDLMARAHILLHASVKEGWGLVVLEAAHVGTPSVVYNVTGLSDVVKDKKTGVVVSDNSPRTMAKEAVSLFRDAMRYKRFQKEGYMWEQSLRWEDVVLQSEACLKKAIKKVF